MGDRKKYFEIFGFTFTKICAYMMGKVEMVLEHSHFRHKHGLDSSSKS